MPRRTDASPPSRTTPSSTARSTPANAEQPASQESTAPARPGWSPSAPPSGAAGWATFPASGKADSVSASRDPQRPRNHLSALALDTLSRRNSVTTNFGDDLRGVAGLRETVALRGSKSFASLVAADRFRAAYAQKNPDSVWVATSAKVGTTAELPLGFGASVGFSGSLEATTLLPHDVKGAADVPAAVKAQLSSLKLPHDSEGLLELGAPPGSELMLRGLASATAQAGVGGNLSAGSARLNASVGVEASAKSVFTKQIKVLDDGAVFFRVSREETKSAGLAASLGSRVDDAGTLGNAADRRLRLRAAADVTRSSKEVVLGAAVLNLRSASDRAVLDHLMKASPEAAADYIRDQKLGPSFEGELHTRSSSAELRFLSKRLLATSSIRTTSTGVLEEPGGKTLLSRADFERRVTGALPRLLQGEERTVSVSAGSLSRDGKTEEAVSVAMVINDPKLDPKELEQYRSFGQAMNAPLSGLPAPTSKKLGKTEFQVQIALVGDQLHRLNSWRPEDVSLAFASAHKELSGGELPPWYSDPSGFGNIRRQYLAKPGGPRGDNSHRVRLEAQYEARYGRNLARDLDSAAASELIGEKLVEAQGKPVEQWAGLLEAVGRQSSTDVRAAVVSLRRLGGAELIELSLKGRTFEASAVPEAAAPAATSDLVGKILAPPE